MVLDSMPNPRRSANALNFLSMRLKFGGGLFRVGRLLRALALGALRPEGIKIALKQRALKRGLLRTKIGE